MPLSTMFAIAKKIGCCLLLLCVAAAAFAQERYAFSQYEQNRYSYLPAVVGAEDAYNVSGAVHVQPRKDAPAWQSYALSAYGPLNMSSFSMGASASRTQTDLYTFGSMQLTGAYSLERWDSRFSFALSLGLARHEFTGWGLPSSTGDTLGNHTQYMPDLGASVFFTQGIFYAGISAQHLGNFKLNATPNGEYVGENLPQQFYLLAGANIGFREQQLSLRPSVLLSYAESEVGANAAVLLTWKDMVWLGGSCKTTQRAGFLAGFSILKKYTLSYSCDFGFGDTRQAAAHEVVLGVRFEPLRKK